MIDQALAHLEASLENLRGEFLQAAEARDAAKMRALNNAILFAETALLWGSTIDGQKIVLPHR